jgi:Ca2+-binding RTX toxin-like protein
MVLAGSAGALVASAAVALAGLPNVICTGGPCSGTPGPDEIAGTGQRDVITAKAGSDYVEALEGNDKVDLGPGNDEVTAEKGADELFGGRGSDRFSGSFGPDVMHGGPGDEREVLTGRRGGPIPGFFTFMFGDTGNDKIYGEGGRDFMEGEEGADLMSGGRGADFLDAIDDDDGGVDRLRCGKGRDRYTAGPEDSVSASCEIEIKLDV